jgi:hypothetical protein
MMRPAERVLELLSRLCRMRRSCCGRCLLQPSHCQERGEHQAWCLLEEGSHALAATLVTITCWSRQGTWHVYTPSSYSQSGGGKATSADDSLKHNFAVHVVRVSSQAMK